jgi:hypothetical protein
MRSNNRSGAVVIDGSAGRQRTCEFGPWTQRRNPSGKIVEADNYVIACKHAAGNPMVVDGSVFVEVVELH